MTASESITVSTGRFALGFSWPLVVAACGYLALLARPADLLIDGDAYWHIAAGRWIFEHGTIPTSDPFSHTLRDAPWTAHEWLSELVLAAAHALGGWVGVVIIAAAAFSAALAILNRFLLRHMEPIYALLFSALSASLLAMHLLARPHTLVAPILATWGVGLVLARERNRAPRWWLAGLMVLWANMHGSFVLGLGLVVVFAVEAIFESAAGMARRRMARDWGVFLIAASIAAMATPFGTKGLLFAFELDEMKFALSVIGEWRSLNFQTAQPFELWLMIGAGAVLLRGLRLPPVRIILLLGLMHLALKHGRHGDLLALIAPVAVAGPFAAQWFAARNQMQQAARLDRCFAALVPPARPAAVGSVLALLVAFSWMVLRADAVRPAASVTPEAAVRSVKEMGVRGPVLNAYEFGGYLIFSGTAPFIDGRADLYGDAFLKRYMEAIYLNKPELLPQLLESYRVGWTLLQPGIPAVALLDHMPGWRRLHADKTAVVHVRELPVE